MSRTLTSFLMVAVLVVCCSVVHGQGLKGEYFMNMTLTGEPALTRTENVNFNWGGGGPGDPIGSDTFSVRWTGSILIPESGEYIFGTQTDDGVRLWVGGELVINNWSDHGATFNRSQPVALDVGVAYGVKLEFYENGGDALMELYWSGPGIPEEIIPVDYLSPTFVVPLKARKPDPANGAIGVGVPLLQWTAGDTAKFHNVYFGSSPELTEADQVASLQLPAVYYHVPGFAPGATYYWRIDEVEKDGITTHTGDVWSFTTQDVTAYYPNPADGSNTAFPTLMMTWMPGAGTVQHHVYFSSSLDAVTARAAEADKGIFAVVDANFAPDPLDTLTMYYWCVDEILLEDAVTPGPVWSFTTCLPVDDFESYTDDEGSRIYETWIDGLTNGNSGSTVGYIEAPFAEQLIVHGGFQSMPLDYNNIDPPFYSEAEREFAAAQNWTTGGANALVLYVRGRLINALASLTVTLVDASGKSGTVAYPDESFIRSVRWVEWKIPFSEFTAAGVNMARIQKMLITLGDKASSAPGGHGLIYIDDIGVIIEPPAE